jgi:hypothetical protein
VAGAVHDGGVPAPESDSAMGATTVGDATARTDLAAGVTSFQTQMGAAATLSDDDDEFEVIMGCPCFHALKPISLPEALDVAHSAVRQAHHVLQREWDDLGVKQQHLKEWGSLLKAHTKSEQQKVAAKREHLDAMEKVLKEEHVAIGRLDQETQDLLEDAKELHATADARASASAKL